MKVLELFAGTRSIGKAFEKRGHDVFSVEWNRDFENINLYADIGELTAQDIITRFGKPDVIWASPDCSTYSIAAISHHRQKEDNGNLQPVSEYAKFCDKVNKHVIELIKELKPAYWFIENPRGGATKNEFHARFAPIYSHILSIWGYKNETYGYMDESSRTAF